MPGVRVADSLAVSGGGAGDGHAVAALLSAVWANGLQPWDSGAVLPAAGTGSDGCGDDAVAGCVHMDGDRAGGGVGRVGMAGREISERQGVGRRQGGGQRSRCDELPLLTSLRHQVLRLVELVVGDSIPLRFLGPCGGSSDPDFSLGVPSGAEPGGDGAWRRQTVRDDCRLAGACSRSGDAVFGGDGWGSGGRIVDRASWATGCDEDAAAVRLVPVRGGDFRDF
jgi:hypothetical protein